MAYAWSTINPNLGKKKLPGLKELWKSGDLEKLVALNAKTGGIRARWYFKSYLFYSTNALAVGEREEILHAP